MGHIRLGPMPRTRKWVEVVKLIRGGAGAAQVANAATDAAEKGLQKAANDKGVVEAVWLLMRLPIAARTGDFVGALRDCRVTVSDAPGLLDIVAGVSDAIDAAMPNCTGRTDLGEMAQMAVTETLAEVIGGRLTSLFDTAPEDVQQEFARLGTVKQFGIIAKDFFARFTNKALDFFLSKTLPDHVGEGKRFRTLGQQADFADALDLHCREAAKIVEEYSGGWLDLHRYEDEEVTRDGAAAFTGYAMTKLTGELRRRDTPHVP